MKIINGKRVFSIDISEMDLPMIRQLLGRGAHDDVRTLLESIDMQIVAQAKPTLVNGEFSTQASREVSEVNGVQP